MKTSNVGINLIKKYEGLRLTAYKPKGRYANPSSDGGGVQDVLNNKKE